MDTSFNCGIRGDKIEHNKPLSKVKNHVHTIVIICGKNNLEQDKLSIIRNRLICVITLPVTYPGRLGGRCTDLGIQTMHPKSTFQVLFFICTSTKKHIEPAISDFIMHLIISKWLRRQKCRQKRKKGVEAKEKTVYERPFFI